MIFPFWSTQVLVAFFVDFSDLLTWDQHRHMSSKPTCTASYLLFPPCFFHFEWQGEVMLLWLALDGLRKDDAI